MNPPMANPNCKTCNGNGAVFDGDRWIPCGC